MAPKDWPQVAPVTSPTLNSEEATIYHLFLGCPQARQHGLPTGATMHMGSLMTIATTEASAARRAREIKRPADNFFQSALDALSAHVVVLDRQGTIVAVNQAWR